MNQPLNFAIVGCGLMGARHAETILNTEGCCCVALFDEHADKANSLGKQLGIEVADTFENLLARKDVDVIVICLPSSLHSDHGIQAANAGKHVICEKPIDISVEKSEALISTCQKKGVLLTVISQNRFLEGSMALKRAMEQKILGEPLVANVSIKWFRDDAYYTNSNWRGRFDGEGGGVFMNQGIHYTDLLLWYLGEMTDTCSIMKTSRDIIETEDVGAVLLKTTSNAIATITASTSAYPGFPERLELHCTKGSAILEQGKIVFWKQMENLEPPEVTFPAPSPDDLNPKLIPFQRQYRDFVKALKNGGQPLVTPNEALSVLKTILSAYDRKF
jgi:UDP-N-acetyl-2-amino-2-deoxyglucuronate dehydrogenase